MFFKSPPWEDVTYWALDLETGGLDPRRDPILAVGMVPVRGGTIRIGEAYRTLVRPEGGAAIDPASIEAHQLLWGEVRDAPPLEAVLPEVHRRLEEGVLLVHHRSLDVRFLREAGRRHGVKWPSPQVVDTVDLLLKRARREQRRHPELPADPPPLNLSIARRSLGLPDYTAHDALTDAIAAAELFLVLRAVLQARTLRDLT